jgi:glutamine amidotransferase
MLTVVDYGMGNLRSVCNALDFLGADYRLSAAPEEVAASTGLILPGVGSFFRAMENLSRSGLAEALDHAVVGQKTPILGICLGMQLLAEYGTEDGNCRGLGWISGRVVRLHPASSRVRLPHVGFNTVDYDAPNPLLENIGSGSDFYFVHSYHFTDIDPACVLAATNYFGPFASVVGRDNVFGTQFHPEKSQSNGIRLLSNFLKSASRTC